MGVRTARSLLRAAAREGVGKDVYVGFCEFTFKETHMPDPTITPALLDQLLANYEKPEDLTGENGLFKQLKKALNARLAPS